MIHWSAAIELHYSSGSLLDQLFLFLYLKETVTGRFTQWLKNHGMTTLGA